MKNLDKQKEKNAYERFMANYITNPNDVITILHSTGIISSSIDIKFSNESTGEKAGYGSLINKKETWNILKEFNEIGGRKVLYQIDNNEPIPFEDSAPYKHRFTESF